MATLSQADDSIRLGMAALAEAQSEAAIKWFDRAVRLAPDSPTAAFMNAGVLLRSNPQLGVSNLRSVIDRWPNFRAAYFGLVAATLKHVGPDAAATALSTTLHRFCVFQKEDLQQLSADVSRASGAPGCMYLGSPITLKLHIMRRYVPAILEVGYSKSLLYSQPLQDGPECEIEIQLPADLPLGSAVTASLDGVSLLGSNFTLSALLRVEAVLLSPNGNRLRGYAWRPGAPEIPPTLTLRAPGQPGRTLRVPGKPHGLPWDPTTMVRNFSIPLPREGPVHVLGPDGRDIPGSPVFTNTIPPPRLPRRRRPRGLDVVIPVVSGTADLRSCLASLRNNLPACGRIVVVADGVQDPELLVFLKRQEAAGTLVVLRHPTNRGYPAAINTGLRNASGRDVILLNSDTLLPARCVDRLAAAAYSAPKIGSVTPLSNEASIVSYPNKNGGNVAPVSAALRQIDRLCQEANEGRCIDLPTAVGFCMYVRGDCLAEVGGFREDAFAQGYGEENEWCCRAALLGWRHVAATGVFVSHLGGRSFGSSRAGLMARNRTVLNDLHPGYDASIKRFHKQNPLAAMRCRLDMARWTRAGTGPLVILVSHNLGGGVERLVQERCEALHRSNLRTLIARPAAGTLIQLDAGPDGNYPNLFFDWQKDWPTLKPWLDAQRPQWLEIHQTIGHAPGIELIAKWLGLPIHIYVHDNAFFCPQVTFMGRAGRYCGEPSDTAVCDACVAELGSAVPNLSSVATMRMQSQALFASAAQVIVPCEDVAQRVRRYTGVVASVQSWQDDSVLPQRSHTQSRAIKVAVLGSLNRDKGMDVLRDCARAASSQRLPIEFVLVGHSADDEMLLESGVFVTGKFDPPEAAALLRREDPSVGFLPSVVPETWCYALTTLWEAGLDVLGFDLGAQAERIRATGRGRLLPLGVSSDQVLESLLEMHTSRTRFRSNPSQSPTSRTGTSSAAAS